MRRMLHDGKPFDETVLGRRFSDFLHNTRISCILISSIVNVQHFHRVDQIVASGIPGVFASHVACRLPRCFLSLLPVQHYIHAIFLVPALRSNVPSARIPPTFTCAVRGDAAQVLRSPLWLPNPGRCQPTFGTPPAHLDKKPRFGHIFTGFQTAETFHVVSVAQVVRAPVCGTGSRGFKPHHSPVRYLRP